MKLSLNKYSVGESVRALILYLCSKNKVCLLKDFIFLEYRFTEHPSIFRVDVFILLGGFTWK